LDNGNGHRNWTSGWVSNVIVLICYIATTGGIAAVTISNTNNNKDDIEKQERIHREDMKLIHDDMNRINKTIQDGFRDLRREIRDSK